jgi:hypothetical protein
MIVHSLIQLPLAVYFRANPPLASQRTNVAAAITAPNNFENAAWTKLRLSTSTGNAIICDAFTNTYAVCAQNPIPGMQMNHSYRAYVEVKADTLGGIFFVDAGTTQVILHGTDGTHSGASAGITVTDLGAVSDGYFAWWIDVPKLTGAWPGCAWYAVNLAWATTFTAVGGERVYVRNIQIWQTNCSALASIKGTAGAVAAAQAGATAQPQVIWYNAGTGLYSPVNMDGVAGWRARMYTDGVNDSMVVALAGLSQPLTIMTSFQLAAGSQSTPFIFDSITAGHRNVLYGNTGTNAYSMYAGSTRSWADSAGDTTATHTIAARFYGASSDLWIDAISLGAAQDCNVQVADGLTIGADNTLTLFTNGYYDEISICNGFLLPGAIAAYHRDVSIRCP